MKHPALMESLLAKSLGLKRQWEERLDAASHTDDEPYNDMGWLANAMCGLLGSPSQEEVGAVFDSIERALVSGDRDTIELLTVGFLEDLQNVSLNRGIALATWAAYLGPSTGQRWQDLVDMWKGDLSPEEFNSRVRTTTTGA